MITEKLISYEDICRNAHSGNVPLTEAVSSIFKKIHALNFLNAFLEVYEDEAMERASIIQRRIVSGDAGRLAGAFIAVKDNILHKGKNTGAASSALEDFQASCSATIVKRLQAEDAIIVGRTNCDEFAMGSSGERSIYGPTLYPFDHQRVPGGSSSGSAVAVAAGLCHAAIGTDTGGSIRQPAAYCGSYGLKPSYGAVSRYGCISYAPSFDQPGPIAADLNTLQLVFNIISGDDDKDSTTVMKSNSKEAVPSGVIFMNFDEKAQKWDKIKNILYRSLNSNIDISETKMKYEDKLMPCYHTLTMAEASSSMARYQNIYFGKSIAAPESVYNYRSKFMGREVRRKILAGVLMTSFEENRYKNALLWRSVIREFLCDQFKNSDVIVLPATPMEAPFIRQTNNFAALYRHDKFLLPANISGLPSLVIPAVHGKNNLPLGLQIMAGENREDLIFKFAMNLDEIFKTE